MAKKLIDILTSRGVWESLDEGGKKAIASIHHGWDEQFLPRLQGVPTDALLEAIVREVKESGGAGVVLRAPEEAQSEQAPTPTRSQPEEDWGGQIRQLAGEEIGNQMVELIKSKVPEEAQARSAQTVLGWLQQPGVLPQNVLDEVRRRLLQPADQQPQTAQVQAGPREVDGRPAKETEETAQRGWWPPRGLPRFEMPDWVPGWLSGRTLVAAGAVLLALLFVGGTVVFNRFRAAPPESLPETVATEFGLTTDEELGPGVPGELQPTEAPPTATPKPKPTPESPLAAGCPGGYMTYLRFPAQGVLGLQGAKTPDMVAPAGPKLVLRPYQVTKVSGLDGVLLVQTEEGAYYIPASYFPAKGEGAECTPFSEVPGFEAALARITPQGGTGKTLLDGEWWAPIAWGFVLLLVAAAVAETAVKRQLQTLGWLIVLLALLVPLQTRVENDGQWLLYAVGLVTALALGERGALAEVRAALRRTKQVSLPNEVNDLLDPGEGVRRVVVAIDWSKPAWWAAINLVWGLLTSSGSPLYLQLAPLTATVLLGLQCLLFYTLEAWRRNRLGDWGAIGVAFLGGVVSTSFALWLPHGSTLQTIAMLVTTLIGVVIIVLVGISGQEAIERDRIPDGLGAFAAFGLTGLILVVRIWP